MTGYLVVGFMSFVAGMLALALVIGLGGGDEPRR